MSFAKKHNKSQAKFNVDTTGWDEYLSLEDLFEKDGEGTVYPVKAIWINTKGKYGDRPTVASDGFYVNLPQHLLEAANDIIHDQEDIDAINAGKVGLVVRTYKAKNFKNKTCYTVDWVDVE